MKKLTVQILAAFLLVALFSMCNNKNSKILNNMENEQPDYSNEWKTIDSLQGQGLPQSALEDLIKQAQDVDISELKAKIAKQVEGSDE